MTQPLVDPPVPGKYWPFENFLRLAAIVLGLLAISSLRGGFVAALLVWIVPAVPGYHASRKSAAERADSAAGELRFHHFNYLRSPRKLRERWAWRLGWIAAYLVLSSNYGRILTAILFGGWSSGWILGEFVHQRTPEGIEEQEVWSANSERVAQRRLEDEWRWAAAFPTYKAYRDAWHERHVGPIPRNHFEQSKRGGTPEDLAKRSEARVE